MAESPSYNRLSFGGASVSFRAPVSRFASCPFEEGEIVKVVWRGKTLLIGPAIGSALIQRYGVPAVLEGVSGFVPVPIIFQVGAALGLLAIVPVLFFRSRSRLGRFQATEAA